MSETRELLTLADSLLSLLWHRHVPPERKPDDLRHDVERTIGDLRAASKEAQPTPPAAEGETAWQPADSFGYCAVCYHPLDRCSHCDSARPEGETPEGLSAAGPWVSPCADHTPDRWEGDGTCVICAAQRLHDQVVELEAEHQQLRAREPAGNPLTACHITPDATGTPLCGASDGHGTIRLAHYQTQPPHVGSLRICPACEAALAKDHA